MIHNEIERNFAQPNINRLVVNINSIDHSNSKASYLNNHMPFIRVSGIIMGMNLKPKNVFIELCKKHKMDLFESFTSNHMYKIESRKILNHGLRCDYRYAAPAHVDSEVL